jgi:hypothetical protein
MLRVEAASRQILRKITRTIVRFPAKWYFNHQFKQAFTNDYDAFWVVDIDNTIADSWRKMTPQYANAFRSQSDKIMSFEAFEPLQQLFQNVPPRTLIIFLSARQYIRYFVTKRWLQEKGFWQADSVLVLVERMADKAPLLAEVLENNFAKKAPPQYFKDFDPQTLATTANLLPLPTPEAIINATLTIKSSDNHYPIVYFDDLSYNHENGEVLYYDDVIEAVQKMPIRYIGYEELLVLQNAKEK